MLTERGPDGEAEEERAAPPCDTRPTGQEAGGSGAAKSCPHLQGAHPAPERVAGLCPAPACFPAQADPAWPQQAPARPRFPEAGLSGPWRRLRTVMSPMQPGFPPPLSAPGMQPRPAPAHPGEECAGGCWELGPGGDGDLSSRIPQMAPDPTCPCSPPDVRGTPGFPSGRVAGGQCPLLREAFSWVIALQSPRPGTIAIPGRSPPGGPPWAPWPAEQHPRPPPTSGR